MTVADLMDRLGVTATAVRQRIDRMLELGFVDREKVGHGRGRPTFAYTLSPTGHREAGADSRQLAEAMWMAISELPDEEVRRSLLKDIAQRLGAEYRQQLTELTLPERMAAMSQLLVGKRILAEFADQGSLPVLDVHACPYPDLTDDDRRRDMCHLEEEMLSEALGQPMHLSACQLDGHGCCQFTPVERNTEN